MRTAKSVSKFLWDIATIGVYVSLYVIGASMFMRSIGMPYLFPSVIDPIMENRTTMRYIAILPAVSFAGIGLILDAFAYSVILCRKTIKHPQMAEAIIFWKPATENNEHDEWLPKVKFIDPNGIYSVEHLYSLNHDVLLSSVSLRANYPDGSRIKVMYTRGKHKPKAIIWADHPGEWSFPIFSILFSLICFALAMTAIAAF